MNWVEKQKEEYIEKKQVTNIVLEALTRHGDGDKNWHLSLRKIAGLPVWEK